MCMKKAAAEKRLLSAEEKNREKHGLCDERRTFFSGHSGLLSLCIGEVFFETPSNDFLKLSKLVRFYFFKLNTSI